MAKRAGDKVGDSVIMTRTVRELDGDKVKLTFELNGGHVLDSGWMPSSQLKAKEMMNWCQHVRDSISDEHEEAEAIKKRGEMPSVEVVEAPAVSTAPTDPDDFIRQQVHRSFLMWQEAQKKADYWNNEVKTTSVALTKWEQVAKGMSIELVGEIKDVSNNESEQTIDSGEGPSGEGSGGTAESKGDSGA